MSRTTLLLALLALLMVDGLVAAKKTKKGTKWSPKSGNKPGTTKYLIETKDNPKKEKLNGKNQLDTKTPGHGGSVLPKPESEVEPGGKWKGDDKWWATTPGPDGHWTDNAAWSVEVTGEPEDLKWTETTPLWDTKNPGGTFWNPNNPGGTWNHDHDKWTGADPEPEGKWKDDGKWTEPQPGHEDPKWTETTPRWTSGPGGMTWKDEPEPEQANTWIKAECVLSGVFGVGGTIHLTEHVGHGAVKFTGEVTGLHDGLHGFHVHEFGDATDGCKSAGSHFNPDGSPHGGPTSGKGSRHAGDLGNLEAHGGSAKVDLEDKMISLIGKDSIIGRSMMVHAKEDDLTKDADPGPRLACGVIGLAKGHNGDDVDGKWTTMAPVVGAGGGGDGGHHGGVGGHGTGGHGVGGGDGGDGRGGNGGEGGGAGGDGQGGDGVGGGNGGDGIGGNG